MKIPDAGFQAILQKISVEKEATERLPLNKEETAVIAEGFRRYARHLVVVIDGTGVA